MRWKGRIEGLTLEGMGVGRRIVEKGGKEHPRPIFIEQACPGDEVEAEIESERGKYAQGRLLRVLAPSEHRREPRCKHFGTCGGCSLQHISYEEQLRQKARQIVFALERAGVAAPKVKVLPSRKMHKYRWRSKVWVHFQGGGVHAGFRKRKSHKVVKVEECFIVMPHIMELISLLNAQAAAFTAQLPVTVVVGEKEKLGLLVHLDDVDEKGAVQEFFERLYGENRKLIGNLFFEREGKIKTAGQVQEHITYSADGMRFSFLPETFIQSNVPTNELLIQTAMRLLKPREEEDILDLYAGIGNFSLPAAKRCGHVVAIEANPSSVTAGELNMLRNGISNVTYRKSSAEKFLKNAKRFSTVILDPPRTGCSKEVVERLRRLRPARILYVSCNPGTLAQDIAELGYTIEQAVGIDMFPDVCHVETLCLLVPQERLLEDATAGS